MVSYVQIMTNKLSALVVAGVATLVFAAPVFAQSGSTSPAGSTEAGVVLAVSGGGLSSAVDLNDAGTANFKTGFNVGGALGYQFNPNVEVRATYAFGRSSTAGTALPASIVAGTKLNRHYYGAELKLNAPVAGGITPYLLLGGGAVTFQPDTTPSQDSFTKAAGKAGVGVSYVIPSSNISVFVEGSGWAYGFDKYSFDKTQFDLTWSGGFSIKFK